MKVIENYLYMIDYKPEPAPKVNAMNAQVDKNDRVLREQSRKKINSKPEKKSYKGEAYK